LKHCSFKLERLLNIFWSVLNGTEDVVCPEDNAQSSEIFMQISSLVSLGLLSQARQAEASPLPPRALQLRHTTGVH
jgi:hypothetical protein